MGGIYENFLDLEVIGRYLPNILKGLLVTVELALAVILTGLYGGLAVAVARTFGVRPVNWTLTLFVDIFRALPPLVIMVCAYFGLPYFGIRLGGFTVAWLTLSLVLAAFSGELIWAGLSTLAKGQREAARATGLSEMQALTYVTLPQALRLVIAPLTSRVIAITKHTSLASVVAVPELLSEASAAQGYAANASPLTAAAIGYLIILFPLVVFSRHLEDRYGWKR